MEVGQPNIAQLRSEIARGGAGRAEDSGKKDLQKTEDKKAKEAK